MSFQDFVEKYSVNRVARMKHKARLANNEVPMPPEPQQYVDTLFTQLSKTHDKVRAIFIIRTFCYLLLYASVVSAFAGEYFEIAFKAITFLSGVIGTAVIIIGIAISHHFTNLYVSDALIMTSEIIAITTHYRFDKKKSETTRKAARKKSNTKRS